MLESVLADGVPDRFATELAGRKARRKGWNGLADEMARAGWFASDPRVGA